MCARRDRRPYDIVATSHDAGVIEAIPDTVSIDALKKVCFGDRFRLVVCGGGCLVRAADNVCTAAGSSCAKHTMRGGRYFPDTYSLLLAAAYYVPALPGYLAVYGVQRNSHAHMIQTLALPPSPPLTKH